MYITGLLQLIYGFLLFISFVIITGFFSVIFLLVVFS